ncbi:MAG: hypothetical protein ACLQBL_10905 [Polyangiaceae bacterium]|jgi:hypothetical protein
MHRSSLATLFFALAAAHAIAGGLLADADSATIAVAGATMTTRWLATQLLGASIAGYVVGGFATLGVAAPESWRTVGAFAGAVSSLLLASLIWKSAPWWPVLSAADTIVILAVARVGLAREVMEEGT